MALSKTIRSLIGLLAKSIAVKLKNKEIEQNTKQRRIKNKKKP